VLRTAIALNVGRRCNNGTVDRCISRARAMSPPKRRCAGGVEPSPISLSAHSVSEIDRCQDSVEKFRQHGATQCVRRQRSRSFTRPAGDLSLPREVSPSSASGKFGRPLGTCDHSQSTQVPGRPVEQAPPKAFFKARDGSRDSGHRYAMVRAAAANERSSATLANMAILEVGQL